MSSLKGRVGVAAGMLFGGLTAAHMAGSQGADSGAHSQAKDRARIVASQPLPKLAGDHLKAVVVEVRYGPGEASEPHSHPCAVVGYVVEGALRTEVKGEPEKIYQAGESFYEAPNGVHLVSRNASSTGPLKLLAYFICDHDTPLSVDVPESGRLKGSSR